MFRARDTIHGRTVVIKRVPSAIAPDSERGSVAARACAVAEPRLAPGIASLYDCGEQDGALYLVQEYVPGQRLSELIGGRPLNPRRAIEIALDVAEALGALHQEGFHHDDLDPDNIVITPKGHAKLLDAGLAAFTAGGTIRATAGARLGSLPVSALSTVRYLSPEQALGERIDERSDLFALGAVLYEMLTGQPPFDATTADAAVLRVLQATPVAASRTTPNVPSELDMIVGRLLAKSLDRRYASAARTGGRPAHGEDGVRRRSRAHHHSDARHAGRTFAADGADRCGCGGRVDRADGLVAALLIVDCGLRIGLWFAD